jgi:siroheme synthase
MTVFGTGEPPTVTITPPFQNASQMTVVTQMATITQMTTVTQMANVTQLTTVTVDEAAVAGISTPGVVEIGETSIVAASGKFLSSVQMYLN